MEPGFRGRGNVTIAPCNIDLPLVMSEPGARTPAGCRLPIKFRNLSRGGIGDFSISQIDKVDRLLDRGELDDADLAGPGHGGGWPHPPGFC